MFTSALTSMMTRRTTPHAHGRPRAVADGRPRPGPADEPAVDSGDGTTHTARGAAARRRALARAVHLLATIPLGAAAYGPPEVALALRVVLRWAVFPALALTGVWMWQGPRVTRAARRWRARRHAETRPATRSGTRPAGRLHGAPGAASRRSLALLTAATLTGLLHHADHVLRADHSGWPFTPEVTALTPSLLAYALLYGAYRYRARPRVGAALVGALLVFTQAAHVVVETPHQQYDVWATGVSHLPHAYGQPNLLHLASPALGVAAAAVSILLSALLLATALSLLADARRTAARP